MPTFASRILPLALFILINVPNISARRGSGGGGSSSNSFSSLNLDSIDAAVFAMYIIFAVFTAFQVFKAFSALRKRLPDEDYPRRIPYILLILLLVLTLIATYSLGAVIQSQTNSVTMTSVDWKTALAMLGFTRTLAHVFLYAGLLLLIDYRSTIQALQYGHARSKQFVIVLRCVGGLFLLLMLVCEIARVIISSTDSLTWYLGEPEPSAVRAYIALYHLFIASYLITTILICAASIVLWTNSRPAESQYEWVMYDTHVLSRIVKIICPIIAIRATYELIADIITSTPEVSYNMDGSAFALADILIQGFTYYAAVHVALGLGLLPKTDEEKKNKNNAS